MPNQDTKKSSSAAWKAFRSAKGEAEGAAPVDAGKSFALFKRAAKPVNVEANLDAADAMPPVPEVEDAAFSERVGEVTPAKKKKLSWGAPREGSQTTAAPAEAHPDVEPRSPQGDEDFAQLSSEPEKKSWFGGRKKAPVADAPQSTADESALVDSAKAPRASTFFRRKPAAEQAHGVAEKQSTVSRKEKPARKGKRGQGGAPADELYLHTELNEGTRLWWRLTRQGLEAVEESAVSRALSFSPQDYCYAAHKPLSFAQATDLVLSESSEYCSMVNLSGGPFGAIHATPRERATSSPWAITPGVAALGILLQQKLSDKQPSDDIKAKDSVVGLTLDDGRGTSLVVLCKLTGDHQLTNLQISVNVEDLGFVLGQFAQSARINSDDAPVLLFTADELLAVAPRLQAFPNEAVWQGYSVRKMLMGALAVSAAAAAVTASLAGWEFYQNKSLLSERTQKEARIAELDAQSSAKVNGAVRSFAQKASLDHVKIFDDAQALWLPGSTVVMTADYLSGNVRYELRMMLPQGQPYANRPSVAFALTPESLTKLVDYKTEDGCAREGTYISGSLNEVQIIINCQVSAGPLSRYRLE